MTTTPKAKPSKPVTPGAVAKHFSKHPACPAIAILSIESRQPAGKGGWKTVGKTTVFYKDGDTLAARHESRINTMDNLTQWADGLSLRRNGICGNCGTLNPVPDSLRLVFFKVREPGHGETMRTSGGEKEYPLSCYGWGYLCLYCRGQRQATPTPAGLNLVASSSVVRPRAYLSDMCDDRGWAYITVNHTLEEGESILLRTCPPATNAQTVTIKVLDAGTGHYQYTIGDITAEETIQGGK